MKPQTIMLALLGLTAGSVQGEDAPKTVEEARASTLVSQQFEADFEALVADDIQLLQGGLAYGQKKWCRGPRRVAGDIVWTAACQSAGRPSA